MKQATIINKVNRESKLFFNGKIPKDWKLKELASLGNVSSGGTPDTTNEMFWNGNINWCTPTDITKLNGSKYIGETTVKITDKGLKNSSATLLPKGSVIVCTRATIGKAAISVDEISTNQGFKNIIPNSNEVDVEFLYYSIINSENYLLRLGNGSTFLEVSKSDFENFKILLPPLSEQKSIAKVLTTADIAIRATEKLIAQKELRKKWLMRQLLTGKKRLKGFEKTKWHLKSLEEVAEFKNGKAHENVIDENGKFIVINSKFISTEGKIFKCSNENLSPLIQDDIVMVMSDIPNGKALAKCFYITENNKYTLNQRICSIRTFEDTDSQFLFFILNRNIHYLGFDNGVGQTNLKKEEVLECPLLMPDKEEQTAIARVLEAADKEIQLLKTKTEKLREQKKGLMQQLLTGKKRLKINGN